MKLNAVELEEKRLLKIEGIDDYDMLHERHRVFPAVFENRNHKKIIDLSAGVGVVGIRIREKYNTEIICNDISPKCLKIMRKNGLKTTSFNLDKEDKPFPINDESFDAVIALATIEHLYNIDNFMKEIKRILTDKGFLYISAPNYSGVLYLFPFLLTGKTFHDPFDESSRYEFYAHIRYFTYKTLVEYISSFGFAIEAVYLPLPAESTKYQSLHSKSKIKALFFRNIMRLIYTFFSPRWASEPVLCFRKEKSSRVAKPRKVIL